jgi:hypothetical protein
LGFEFRVKDLRVITTIVRAIAFWAAKKDLKPEPSGARPIAAVKPKGEGGGPHQI